MYKLVKTCQALATTKQKLAKPTNNKDAQGKENKMSNSHKIAILNWENLKSPNNPNSHQGKPTKIRELSRQSKDDQGRSMKSKENLKNV